MNLKEQLVIQQLYAAQIGEPENKPKPVKKRKAYPARIGAKKASD